MEILISFVRGLFMLIDKVIVYLIEWSYDLLMKLADVNVFNDSVIEMFGKRVYALLGIFMLFKLSFSLINYLLNPDDFTAKDKGFSKIITNVMTVIVLIVTVPTIFKYAFVFQGEVLKNKVLERIILGVGTPTETTAKEDARFISFAVFSAFYEPNKEIPAIGKKCEDVFMTRDTGYDQSGDLTGCAAAIKSAMGEDSEFFNVVYTFDEAVENNSVNLLYSNELANAKADGTFLFDYKIIISSVVGGLVAVIFIQFCFDISIRAVKLGFLQLIAPIPIVSYIDPKSGKDGMFKKWYKESLSTFLDIFIRLGAVFFAIFVISIVANNRMETYTTPGNPPNPLVQIFIIVGALLFAKQLPKLIENLTGMKLSGGFTLNPMNRIRQTPIIGGAMAGIAGIAGGTLAGVMAGHESGHPVRGGLMGAFGGAKAGVKGIGITGSKDGKSNKAFSTGANTAYKNFTGKDFTMLTSQKIIGRMQAGTAKQELDEIDKRKVPIKNEQSMLDNMYDVLKNQNVEAYKKYQAGDINQTEYENIAKRIHSSMSANRKSYSDYDKQLKVIDDRKEDVKRMYNYDESNKYTMREVDKISSDLEANVVPLEVREKAAGKQALDDITAMLNTTRSAPTPAPAAGTNNPNSGANNPNSGANNPNSGSNNPNNGSNNPNNGSNNT